MFALSTRNNLVSVFTEYNYVGDVFVELQEYITHCDRILRGLESLQALQDAGLTNFSFEGIQIYDHTYIASLIYRNIYIVSKAYKSMTTHADNQA